MSQATGGTVTTLGNDFIHTFTTTGNSTFTVNQPIRNAQILVVAAGGGGGYDRAAGGGGGGVIYATGVNIGIGSYTVTVGTGGAGSTTWNSVLGTGTNNGGNGGNSSFGTGFIAIGGGGGGTYAAGNARGSGGGGHGQNSYAGGSGRPGQGFAGGAGYNDGTTCNSGGGGGAGAAGTAGGVGVNPSGSGKGGDGVQISISGTATYYGGGGGGSIAFDTYTGTSTGGKGGLGGGGNAGQTRGANGSNGTANTGGGGGGGANIPQGSGGTGGSGIVIIRYTAALPLETLYVQGTLVNTQLQSTDTTIINMDQTDRGPYLAPVTFPAQGTFKGSVSYVTDAPTSNIAVKIPGTSGSIFNFGSFFPSIVDPLTTNVFVEGLVYFNSLTSPNTTQYVFSVSQGGSTTTYEDMGMFMYQPNSQIAFRVWDTLGNQYQAACNGLITSAGVWYHVAGSWDRTNNKVYAFVNGTVGAITATAANTIRNRSSSSLVFSAGDGSAGTYLPGNLYIRDFRITKGGIVPTTSFTPDAAPFSTGSPTYVSGGTNAFTLLPQFNFTYNTSTIQQWIQKTVNSYGKPFWSNNAINYTQLAVTLAAGDKFVGGCLLSDGRVVFAPWNVAYIGIFNPATNAYTSLATSGTGSAIDQYQGAVLSPDGRAIFVPSTATAVGIYNPVTNAWSTAAAYAGTQKYSGGCVGPDGRIIFFADQATNYGFFDPKTNTFTSVTPTGATLPGGHGGFGGCLHPNGTIIQGPGYNYTNILIYNPSTNVLTTVPNVRPSNANGEYDGAVVIPDGRVAFIPRGANPANLGLYNPSTGAFTTITGPAAGTQYFISGCMIPDGRVICSPAYATYGLIFDPVAGTYTTISGLPGSNAYNGIILLPDGRIVAIPTASTTGIGIFSGANRPVPRELCLHPIYNMSN